MRYDMRVTAYDVMDQVTTVVCVYSTLDLPGARPALVLQRVTTEPGTGEPEHSAWARDALVQALESL